MKNKPANSLVELDLAKLGDRLGKTLLQQRLHIQVHFASHIFGSQNHAIHVENVWLMNVTLRYLLKAFGLFGIGNRNYKNIEINENIAYFAQLPRAFDGFRILHLSDVHFDLHPSITDVIIERLRGLRYDLCVITGDFRADTMGDYGAAVAEMCKIIPHIETPVYAILGNHDYIEMVLPLEEAGMRFLLNENVKLQRGKQSLFLAGIDDSFTYETDDFGRACQGIPPGAFSILLSHSPDTFRRACATGFSFMLSGHTHGGQICLPGGFPLIKNARCPNRMVRGAWEYHDMQGYTSAGTGACGVPVRFFCPPEIVIHELRQGKFPLEVVALTQEDPALAAVT